MKILETKNVTKRFGGLVAVNDVSLHVEEGEILGLIGPNGAGKTTFQNAVAGLDPPTSGDVFFLEKKVTGHPPQVMCNLGLSRTFQIPRPFPKLTVLENVMVSTVFGNKKKPSNQYQHAREKLDFVEFPLSHDVLCETLNTVQLKRLDLARALASSPKLCLLDELASGLSEVELDDIISIIRKIRDTGVTIFMVEHIMQVIMNLCDQSGRHEFREQNCRRTDQRGDQGSLCN